MSIVPFNAAERYQGTWIIHRTAGAVSHRTLLNRPGVLTDSGVMVRTACGLQYLWAEVEMAEGRGVDGCLRCLRYAQPK